MEVLQIITGSLAARFLGQHLPMIAVFTAAVDVGQILEEKARALEQGRPRTVVVRGQGIDSRLHIGEILPEQRGHIRIEAVASRHRDIGAGRPTCAPARTLTHGLGQSAHDHPMADVPGNARQLRCPIGDAGGDASNGMSHGLTNAVKSPDPNMGGKGDVVHRRRYAFAQGRSAVW